jgi:PAS domain S-box-containing protein
VVIPRFLNQPAPTHLVDSEVRLDGVCGTIFNQKRQLVGLRLFVPGLEFVEPERTAPNDPYSLPIRSIDSLSQFSSAEERDHRLRVQGTVTFWRPKEFFFVQDDRGGLLVKTEQTGAVGIGDRLDVVGFAATGNYTPVLTQAIFRKLATGSSPATPVTVTAEQALSADFDKDIFDAKLVRLQARLLDIAVRSKEKTLVLQAGSTVFNAYLTENAASQFCSSLRLGSLLEATGVCSVQVDSSRYPKSFEMYLRSSNDIAVLDTPSWWNVSHTISLLAAMGVVVLLTLGWIRALRRRVRTQTALIQQRLERERALEVRYRDLFDANPHPMWVYDVETLRFLAVNDAAVLHYGYTREEFLRITIKEIQPANDGDTVIEQLDSTRGERIRSGTRLRHCRKNGAIINVEVAAHQFVFAGRKARLVLITDVTARMRAEAEMDALNKQLIESSRQAGMAEVATGVLHNVGNVLNSVNVSATLVSDKLKHSRACNLSHVAVLFEEHADDLGAFVTADPKGRRLPAYLGQLASHLATEQAAMLQELELLRKNIEHIKDIVAMQQSYARVSGATEPVNIPDLIEDALRMNAGALARHEVQVIREYDPHLSDVTTEKHKVLQILVNLMRNAKYACDESGRKDKRLTVRLSNGDDRVRISVIDNGVGIPPENLTRIFNHGYTTRKDGHGFGLHSGALAARELGGALQVQSEGRGLGAAFTLELPIQPTTNHA